MTSPSGRWDVARWSALAAFTLSGAAGLIYEVVWSRYLALLVGSSAVAQVAVLAGFLAGMAGGAFLVARRAPRMAHPLRGYAVVEVLLGLLALLFHPAFLGVSWALDAWLLPALGAGAPVRWVLAALLILPGSLLLGATFPLLAAGLVRRAPARPGEEVAVAYLANTLGGAAGVLVGGFVLLPHLGLPGALAVAGSLNGASALLAWRWGGGRAPAGVAPGAEATGGGGPRVAPGLLLAVGFGTAVASFGYEVAWIRSLSLVLGSATHAFELMLSAFLLGLASGAFLVRTVADGAPSPLRLLGVVQVLMGVAALATLPLYAGSFEAVAFVVSSLREGEGGYALFNLTRYALALLIMLPATTLAGMTFPLLTGALVRGGGGEAGIGRMFGWNTAGSVAGVLLAGLVALPALGLKGLLLAAAALDVALGVGLLAVARRAGGGWRLAAGVGVAAVAAGVALATVRLDPLDLTGAVFRYGVLPAPSSRDLLYYRDGRTATVGAYRARDGGRVVLTSNGKPDASLDPPFLTPRRDTLSVLPLAEGGDAATQILAPLLGLAHAPRAARVANVGHGSGMSAAALLGGAAVEEVVTLEIEPAMVEGSRVFLPANRTALEDPRSRIVIGDARVLLAFGEGSFDLVVSEPSNPWVSGNAGLFTREFYRRVRRALTPGGVVAQWIQLYEVDDALVLTVVAALSESFPRYRGYLVGDRDLVLVARADGPLPEPDWTVFDTPAVRALLQGFPPPSARSLSALELFDEGVMAPLVARVPVPNSDLRPVLEYGAERARFEGRTAEGILGLGEARVALAPTLRGVPRPPWTSPGAVLARGLAPMVRLGRASWLQAALRGGEAPPVPGFPEWEDDARAVAAFEAALDTAGVPESWSAWTRAFVEAEERLHGGTALWADTTFYRRVAQGLERWGAPGGPRRVVALLRGVTGTAPSEACDAGVALDAGEGHDGLAPALRVDASVVACLAAGRADDGRRILGSGGAALPGLRADLLRAALDAGR